MFDQLKDLFSSSQLGLQFLTQLNQKAVIAGGSVVYNLLNDSTLIPNDIDVFLLKDSPLKPILELIEEFFVIKRYQITNPSYEGSSVIDVILADITIQIIFTQCENANELIDSFDMDYVQCAYYQNKLYITEDCKRAHQDRRIYKISPETRYDRLLKAIQKGFKSVLFYTRSSFPVYKNVEKKDLLEMKFEPIKKMAPLISVDKLEFLINEGHYDPLGAPGGVENKYIKKKFKRATTFFDLHTRNNVITDVKYIAIHSKVVRDGYYIQLEDYPMTLFRSSEEHGKVVMGQYYTFLVRPCSKLTSSIRKLLEKRDQSIKYYKLVSLDDLTKCNSEDKEILANKTNRIVPYFEAVNGHIGFKIIKILKNDSKPLPIENEYLQAKKLFFNNQNDENLIKMMIEFHRNNTYRHLDDKATEAVWCKLAAYESFLFHFKSKELKDNIKNTIK